MAASGHMRLGDVVRFGNGKAIKPGGTGDYPVYGSNGIIGGSDEFRHENGVVIGRVGAYCGSVVYCPTKFWASDNTLVAYPGSDRVDTKFLYYLLADAKLSRYAGGAAQPLVTQTVLKQVEVLVPPLPIQRRIAGILSAYDELIENSQRRIKILESMARALYREWFVHFRFPGHESVPRVPSPLGEIPQGWEVQRIDEALRFDSGRTIKKEERENGNTPVYGANGTIGGTANRPMAEKCIIMGKIGSCGSLHRSHIPCWVTNNAFLVQPASIRGWELAWQVLLDIDFKQYIGGAANPYMPINAFGQHEVLVAPDEMQFLFERHVAPMHRVIELLSEGIENLRRTRDLLLPRLLSGQIDVEAMPA
jgi:type I restriction enzyme S subunit